ncbi:LruC domain-containing protein [Chondrinema litorale]|uniref:LruC domain-containing protein n=1 Tax=Chondrinema litorale TaxID=2994555 RepID=UPI002543F764|nr:LruC domain-containing protein [Chondrinema litorale]UZR98241.1 LruC domain-containing protein [Chondrinema litorale]
MKLIKLTILLLSITLSACEYRPEIEKDDLSSQQMEELNIPENFDFNNGQSVTLQIKDNDFTGNSRINVYILDDTKQKSLIASGSLNAQGEFTKTITLSGAIDNVRVEKIFNGKKQAATLDITGTHLSYTFNSNVSMQRKGTLETTANCAENLYSVNEDEIFYSINTENNNFDETFIAHLPGNRSYACAVDRNNNLVYYNTRKVLRYYEIDTDKFHVVGNGNPFDGDYARMGFNNTNGLLYISDFDQLYTVDPTDNTVTNSIAIVGLDNTENGDLDFTTDGELYMCTLSGLYKLDIDGNVALATRISAENLPFQPTSLAIDKNDRLFLATVDDNSQLIEMDKEDGTWSVLKTFDHKITDLGSASCGEQVLDQTDTDNDGIIDVNDDYPSDANKAFNTYTPRQFGWGTLAFEDMWPDKGDYDFNDLVVNYRITAVYNADNKVAELIIKTRIKTIGGYFRNGFGIEFPFTPEVVASVTGNNNLQAGLINVAANGLESDQDNAVLILFDNAYNVGEAWVCSNSQQNDTEVTITFTEPIIEETLGTAPFNPFIFINGDRQKEVHLSGKNPTKKMNKNLFGSSDDNSNSSNKRWYKTKKNLPWAISVVYDFEAMKEGKDINRGYLKFKDWAESGGSTYNNWYIDVTEYRDDNEICQ